MTNVVSGIGGQGNVTSGVQRYFAPFNTTGGTLFSTESNVQTPIQSGFVAQHMNYIIPANSLNVGPTVSFRKNGVTTALAIPLPTSFTGTLRNLTDSVTVAPGDNVDILMDTTASSSGVVSGGLNFECVNSSGHQTRLNASAQTLQVNTASTTVYICGSGLQYPESSTESKVANYLNTTGTWRYAQIRVTTNSRPQPTTLRNRINGANGSMAVVIPGSSTGVFTDLSSSDTVNPGDVIDWSLTTGTGAGAIVETLISSQINYPATSNDVFWMAGNGGDACTNSNSHNTQLRWPLTRSNVVGQEDFGTSRAATCLFKLAVSQFSINILTNTYAGSPMVINTMLEGIPQPIGVSVPAGFTGRMVDVSGNSAVWNVFDRWSWQFDNRTPAVGVGNFQIQSISAQMTDQPITPATMRGVQSITGISTISI